MDVKEEIYKTVETIVQRYVADQNQTEQVSGIVLDAINGKYTVLINGSKYVVKDGVGINPAPNTSVWVCIPNNDWNKAYICAGKSTTSGGSGDVMDVYQNNVSVLGEDKIARVRCATPEDIQQLQANFQAGVDAIGNACIRKGSTPASSSLEDTVAAIDAIQTGGNYMTKEITQDGTYYASDDDVDAYNQVIVAVRGGLRPHTVTFLDKNEETVLEVVTDVPWGGGAAYHGISPTTSGMRFVGWTPNPVYVTEDLWCKARFENVVYSPDQIQDDWVSIARHCKQNSDYYSTGKWKLLELQNGVSLRMQLVGKDVDIAEGENGYNNTTWLAMDVLDMNLAWATPPHYGGWAASSLKNYLNTTFLTDLFPTELAPYLSNTVKYSRSIISGSGVVSDYPSLETIWIPSCFEMGAGYENLGTYYDVAFDNGRQKSVYSGWAKGYWTRTQDSEYRVMRVNNSGNVGNVSPDNTSYFGLLIGFCL